MDAEEKFQQLSNKVSDLFFGLKVIGLLFLVVSSVGNIVAALSIDSFGLWFAIDLPGKPLPAMTALVLEYRSLLYVLSLVWPFMGLAVLLIRERIRFTMVLLTGVLLITMLQSTLTAVALYLPTVSLNTGMTKSHP